MRLIVETPGTRLSFDRGVLVIENRQENKITEFPFLHITSLHLFPKVRVSTDVLNYCIRSGIPVFLENTLEVTGLIWAPDYGSITHIRRRQTLLSMSPLRWDIIRRTLIRKNRLRHELIRKLTTQNNLRQLADEILAFDQQIQQAAGAEAIRSAEALASKAFFDVFKQLLPRHCPFERREYHGTRNPVNALLNYGYGMLYKEVTKSLIQAGLDPYMGFMHRHQHNRPALAYDMVEPYRPWIEQLTIRFCRKTDKQTQMTSANGQLSTPFRRHYARFVLEFLDNTKIRYNDRTKTPRSHIRLDMQQLAQHIKNYDDETLLDSIRHCQ